MEGVDAGYLYLETPTMHMHTLKIAIIEPNETFTVILSNPVGVTFGTKTGQLWHSSDEGGSWRRITTDLPEIWAVESVVVD